MKKYDKKMEYNFEDIFQGILILLIISVFTMGLKTFMPQSIKEEIRKNTSDTFNTYVIECFKMTAPIYQYTMENSIYDNVKSEKLYIINKYLNNQFPIITYVIESNDNEAMSELDSYIIEVSKNTERNNEELFKELNENITNKVQSKTYTLQELKNYEFLIKTFYVIDSTTNVKRSELDVEKILNKKFNVNLTSKKPKILIYHTHASEAFVDSRSGVKNDTIVGAGKELKEILEKQYGVTVIHDTNVYDMIGGKLDRSYAYNLAEQSIRKILKNNPSIEVVIDLHRDGVNGNKRLVTEINGEQVANIMFFNGVSRKVSGGKVVELTGLPNPYVKSNLALSLQLQLQAAKDYPGFTRKIYIKGYRYNQHLRDKSLLVEVGAQTNTVEEAKRAMKPLADILYKVLTKK